MKFIEVQERSQDLIQQLLIVWEKSVRETHLFLSDTEIENIKNYVPDALNEVTHLIIENDEEKRPIAFMGIENNVLEMLFITPKSKRKRVRKNVT